MLNLSHNKFKKAFVDWWTNGHQIIDLRFNSIKTLWDCEDIAISQNYKTAISTPLKEVWIGNNDFGCDCKNIWFLDFIQTHWKAKIIDIDSIQCSLCQV
ncbi:unnamed protein product, partial [Iphiclides podalirius]